MYSTDSDTIPRRPVISTLTGATAFLEKWVRENSYQEIRDKAGLKWNLEVGAEQIPHPRDTQGSLWKIAINVVTKVTAAMLVDTGTLYIDSDARLIDLIGSKVIPIEMKALKFEAGSVEIARSILTEEMPRLRERFENNELHDIKRQIAGDLVDRSCIFGQQK